MNHPSPAEFSTGDRLGALSAEETDAFLQSVQAQMVAEEFDDGDRQVLQQMVECLGDSRGMVRLSFAETIGKIGTPATPVLLEALQHHTNPVVRRAAAKTLTLIADPTAVPTLVQALLNDDDMVVKGSSVGALARTGEVAVPALLDILSNPNHPENYKGLVGWALAFIGSEAKDLVYEQMYSESPEVRAAVIEVIVQVAQENPGNCDRELELLLQSLNDAASIVRCEAATALGNLKYTQGIPPLLELLQHSEAESRKSAALSLMKIGDRTVISSLQTALTQENESSVGQVIKLAITKLENSTPEDDDWDEE
ncbi:MAG: HEAT repeat domain-containing protein [Roseofilum sp. SBFL]|uniref:HEAT repeat domain-containing protein n=1 Tax=unclassified Roseofilum TaxID=2620099 RepID=UPI001B0EEF65|nr:MULTISPECIES: HEAT repeat domain-containing protein [unclassified Roseofilum]MBP0014033.1 HEAT repeat domain-containing protein [Roseofilum sp. SID3]MBP0023079.1 HEAT repeat domain-containing protein [Roseofilum sp. SID2]MBP0040118.1 HEAT repeat domain-containing protein [Roseofilum sp. SID1]MBP0042139.1 HEAT repeat domain-containing protein [Roseofilum sp. SBFL]